LQHLALDIVGKSPANQRDRRLARAKSRNPRHAGEFLGHALHGLLHFVCGNFQFQLAPARRFSHGSLSLLLRLLSPPPHRSDHTRFAGAACCRWLVHNGCGLYLFTLSYEGQPAANRVRAVLAARCKQRKPGKTVERE